MLSHLGLRFRMAASYVLVSAAAVLLVEAVLLAVMVPRFRAADAEARLAQQRATQAEQGLSRLKAQSTARNLSGTVAKAVTQGHEVQPSRDVWSLITDATPTGFAASIDPKNGTANQNQSEFIQVLADTSGQVIASNVKAIAVHSILPPAARLAGAQDGKPWPGCGN